MLILGFSILAIIIIAMTLAFDFVNGFIEVYRDARGAKGTSQSFVSLTDQHVNTLMQKIADNGGNIPKELLDEEDAYQSGFGGDFRDDGWGEVWRQPGTAAGFRHPQEPGPSRHNLAAIFDEGAAGGVPEVEVVPEEQEEGVWLGMKVRHAKFGVGTVRKIEGKGDDRKVIVWFNSVGPKKLLVRFAGLERA